MKIAVMGTGHARPPARRTVAAALARLGHEVEAGTRDPQSTLARRKPGVVGVPPFASGTPDTAESALPDMPQRPGRPA